MSKPLATYDPAQVAVIVGGFSMQGYVKGSFVTVDRNENAFNLYVGADGEGARAKSNNKSGLITIRLMQTSDSNDILSGFAKADEVANAGTTPVLIKDNNGKTLCACETAWVQKVPAVDYGNEAGEREWRLESDNIQIFVGGN